MKKLVSGIAGATLLLSGIAVHAASQETSTIDPEIHKLFTMLDANKDGFIEKKEAAKEKDLSTDFDRISKNGKLDESGYATWKVAKVNSSRMNPSSPSVD